MSTFSFTIGDVQADVTPPIVPVTFNVGGETYSRTINAVFSGQGSYDPEATLLRAMDVGRGVINKVTAGVLKTDAQVAAALDAPTPASG